MSVIKICKPQCSYLNAKYKNIVRYDTMSLTWTEKLSLVSLI